MSLRGGVGVAAHKHGLTGDNIISMTMVGAEGRILTVVSENQCDLLWALRGAGGGSFGLVTEFHIQAFKPLAVLTRMCIGYPLNTTEIVERLRGLAANSVIRHNGANYDRNRPY